MIALKHIGKSADDLRFFILLDGRHAGGITVHSIRGAQFSYGIAVSPQLRRQGIAKAALALLFEAMKRRGFAQALVQIEAENEASLALHRAAGFTPVGQESGVIFLTREL